MLARSLHDDWRVRLGERRPNPRKRRCLGGQRPSCGIDRTTPARRDFGEQPMENALLIGLSRQIALQRELDVVANNIANLDTTGYKADGTIFEEYLMPNATASGFEGPDRLLSY